MLLVGPGGKEKRKQKWHLIDLNPAARLKNKYNVHG